MEQNTKAELEDAIRNNLLELKTEGHFPSGHSKPYFYKAKNGDDFVLLKARKDSQHGTQDDIADTYRKNKVMLPFLQKQNLPVETPRELEILTYDGEIYAVMERFFGTGHSAAKFAKATKEQQEKFVKQMANFFFKLHSIPTNTLPKGLDYTPYFKYNKNIPYNKCGDVFLHGDVNYSNFLVDNDYNLHAVFDWEAACVGPRLAEFCTFVYCKDLLMLPLVLKEYNKLAGTDITPEQVIAHEKAREEGTQKDCK